MWKLGEGGGSLIALFLIISAALVRPPQQYSPKFSDSNDRYRVNNNDERDDGGARGHRTHLNISIRDMKVMRDRGEFR